MSEENMKQEEVTTRAMQCFNYGENAVRTVKIDNEVWFVAKDVCDVLELADVTSALRVLDDDERILRKISGEMQNQRGNPNINLINESGLFKLAFRSNKPEAKKFTKWVTSEVLPTLLRIGSYTIPGSSKMSDATLMEAWKIVKKALKVKSKRDCEEVETLDSAFERLTGQSALKLANVTLQVRDLPQFHSASKKKQDIINYLEEYGTATPIELSRAFGMRYDTARIYLYRLMQNGIVNRLDHGVYGLVAE